MKKPMPPTDVEDYVDATALCTSAGKSWQSFVRTDSAKALIAALEESTGRARDALILHERHKNGEDDSIWVHPQIAVHLAQWASPTYALAISQEILARRRDKNARRRAALAARSIDRLPGSIDVGAYLQSRALVPVRQRKYSVFLRAAVGISSLVLIYLFF